MSKSTSNSGLSMNIPVDGIALEAFVEKFLNIIASKVSLERLMDLEDKGVYGSGTMGDENNFNNVNGLSLLVNFLESLEKKPNPFAERTLRYICSKDPDIFSLDPDDNSGTDVYYSRNMLIYYIRYQENKIKIGEEGVIEISEEKIELPKEEVDFFLSDVKDLVTLWIDHLRPKLCEFPNWILTVRDHKPTTIKECLATILKDSGPETTKTALVKLYNELGSFEFKCEYLHGNNLSEICDNLERAIMGNMDFKEYLLEYMKNMH